MGRRLAVAAVLVAAMPAGVVSAAASPPTPDWAAPQIRTLATRGVLMGAASAESFDPAAPLTRGALASLVLGLEQALATSPAAQAGNTAASSGPTGAVATTPSGAPSSSQVARPAATVSIAALDARLVSLLGLSGAAAEFARGARAAGLTLPTRFGTEVVARLLGLRTDHPAAQDYLELLPGDPATGAEAAFSAARILELGPPATSPQVAFVQGLADTFALPSLTDWQKTILDVAVSKIGMPYVLGGTSDGPEAPLGVEAPGGYDCSGYVWRVFKLQSYPDEGTLASTLRARDAASMSVEVPPSERMGLSSLEPADVLFFGTRGTRSTASQITHMGIYLGNGWLIHESSDGVALSPLTGWFSKTFAWGRRPLAEAGLTS